MSKEDYKAVADRAAGLFDGIGRKAGIPPAMKLTLVEMMALDVRDGVVRGPLFLQHPPHLPEGQDLRALVVGAAAKDAQLRSDAHEWAQMNRQEATRAAVTVRNAVEALRMADELTAANPTDRRPFEWRVEIAACLQFSFECDPEQAPAARDALDAWALAVCNKANPVPEWLQTYRPNVTRMTDEPIFNPRAAVQNVRDQGDDDGE